MLNLEKWSFRYNIHTCLLLGFVYMSIRSACILLSTSLTTIDCNGAYVVFSLFTIQTWQYLNNYYISSRYPQNFFSHSLKTFFILIVTPCNIYPFNIIKNIIEKGLQLGDIPFFELHTRVAYDNAHKILWLPGIFLHKVVSFPAFFFSDFLLMICKEWEILRLFCSIHKISICGTQLIQKSFEYRSDFRIECLDKISRRHDCLISFLCVNTS